MVNVVVLEKVVRDLTVFGQEKWEDLDPLIRSGKSNFSDLTDPDPD